VERDELDDEVEEGANVTPAVDECETLMRSRREEGTYQAANGTKTAWLIVVKGIRYRIERGGEGMPPVAVV
jgi:hypothetical protein